MAPDGSCSYKRTLFVAPDDSHCVSLLPIHYPQAQAQARAPEDQPEVIAESVKVLADRLTELEVEMKR